MLAGSVTSRRHTRTLSRPARSRAAETCRIVATTFQPLSANSLAVAWPNAVDEPVISTVFLFMLFPPIRESRSKRSDDDSVEGAVFERPVTLIYLTQRDPFRNQVVRVHPALEVQVGVHRNVALEVGGTEIHAHDAPLATDFSPTKSKT